MLDQTCVREEEARGRLMDDFIATDDVREVFPVQKLAVQPLDIDDLLEPDKVKSRSFGQNDVPAKHPLMMQWTYVTPSASIPELLMHSLQVAIAE